MLAFGLRLTSNPGRCTLCNCHDLDMYDVHCSHRPPCCLSLQPIRSYRPRVTIICAAKQLSHDPTSQRSLQLAKARWQTANLEAAPLDPYAEGLLQLQVG